MTTLAANLDMMRRRRDFVAAARDGVKIGGPLVALQLNDRNAAGDKPRVGFTATKRVGGAVERSRMKRRLREAARAALGDSARPGCDYVLIARRAVLDADFARLTRDVAQAVKRAHGRAGGAGDRDRPPQAAPETAEPDAASPRESGR